MMCVCIYISNMSPIIKKLNIYLLCLNYQFFQKLKLLRYGKFNHLTI